MMRWVIAIAALASSQAVQAQERGAFNCEVERLYSTEVLDGNVAFRELSLDGVADPSEWEFFLRLRRDRMEIEWQQSPVSLYGNFETHSLSDGAAVGFQINRAPCLFTDSNCATMIQYATQPDGSLKLQMHPTALVGYPDGHIEPFAVIIDAVCKPEVAEE
jgi:hypothetical protein